MDQETVALLEKKWSCCKYEPEFDQMLVEHLSKGLSFMSFNVAGGVAYNTLRVWCKRFPSFAQAREIGEKARLKMLEEEGVKMVKGGNVVAWKFMMNQHGVHEKVEVQNTISISPHMQLPPSQRYARLQKLKELHQRVTYEIGQQTIDVSDVMDVSDLEGL